MNEIESSFDQQLVSGVLLLGDVVELGLSEHTDVQIGVA